MTKLFSCSSSIPRAISKTSSNIPCQCYAIVGVPRMLSLRSSFTNLALPFSGIQYSPSISNEQAMQGRMPSFSALVSIHGSGSWSRTLTLRMFSRVRGVRLASRPSLACYMKFT